MIIVGRMHMEEELEYQYHPVQLEQKKMGHYVIHFVNQVSKELALYAGKFVPKDLLTLVLIV
jgi:hypothetical protein